MKININDYILSKPFIQKTILEKKNDLSNTASILAAVSFVPIIAVYCYAGEVLGWTEEIKEAVRRYKKFYGYTKIIGLEENIL